MKKIYSFLLFCFTLLASFHARADGEVTYTFEPANPTTEDIVRLRLDIAGCISADGMSSAVIANEPAIEVKILFSDLACDPDDPGNVTPQFVEVGKLPVAIYSTRVFRCILALPPPPDSPITCNLIQEGTLIVRRVGSVPAIVPATSAYGLWVLIIAFVLWGTELIRRR